MKTVPIDEDHDHDQDGEQGQDGRQDEDTRAHADLSQSGLESLSPPPPLKGLEEDATFKGEPHGGSARRYSRKNRHTKRRTQKR